MSFTLAITFFIWEFGWFWGKLNRRLHILQGKFAILGIGINIDLTIL